ncbi:MAG: hypothetical protein HKO92_03390 [Flavobacteriaceae bacterium]|nr:hypothetical protein [Flavobacteriaceae bacterium]
MSTKYLLITGIISLIIGVLIKLNFQSVHIGHYLIAIGIAFKIIYIVIKVRNDEYNPGKEVLFLIFGLLLFFTGLYATEIVQKFIRPLFLIVFGVILKLVFIVRLINITKSEKAKKPLH